MRYADDDVDDAHDDVDDDAYDDVVAAFADDDEQSLGSDMMSPVLYMCSRTLSRTRFPFPCSDRFILNA